jgi:electron transfer flavoprotein alpha subunit
MSNVMVLAGRSGDVFTDVTLELIGKARELADAWGGHVEVALFGASGGADKLEGADTVLSVEHEALTEYVPEAYEIALKALLVERSPRLLLLPNDTTGLDLGTAVATSWGAGHAASVVELTAEGDKAVATCAILGGKMLADVEFTGDHGVCTVLAGAFTPASGATPEIVVVPAPAELGSLRTALTEKIVPQGGDVDITTADLLVSIGRGIGSKDDLEIAEELADALGAPVSASRPVIDSGWMPKSRQVGKSGLKVKPKAYLAFGISGAPEHLEGMRNAELIIACNTDAGAPIFEVAHYGTTCDLFDLMPSMVEKLEA